MRICMWSGPRNLSTAMMRSFGARKNTAVMDEPFFAPFLLETGLAHPGREETLERHDTDLDKIAQDCAREPVSADVFQKHMPRHMLDGFPLEWAKGAKHFFLIREPARVIASYAKGRAEFTLEDLGFGPQRRFYEKLSALTGEAIPVVDSLDILRNPEGTLKRLCAAMDVPWDAGMLSWEAGPRDTDGAWAPWWYKSVENSTGFAPPPDHVPIVADQYADMLRACEADYAALKAMAL